MSLPPSKRPDECSIYECKEKRLNLGDWLEPYCEEHEDEFAHDWVWCEAEACRELAVMPDEADLSDPEYQLLCGKHGGEDYNPRTALPK